MLFVEFINTLDKFLISYETDMVTPGIWSTKTHSLTDMFNSLKRMNAIYLEGNYLGMKVQAYQRPVPYKDVFVVDGITIQLPIKITEVDAVLLADKQKEDARQKKISSLGLTPEILDDAAQFKCEYYVAYLLTTNNFNHIYIDEVRQLYNQTKINFIMSNYTEAQQAFIIKSVEADKECSKYAKF